MCLQQNQCPLRLYILQAFTKTCLTGTGGSHHCVHNPITSLEIFLQPIKTLETSKLRNATDEF